MIFETARLYAREMQQRDFADLAAMLQDPQVMYAYEHAFTESDVQVWLDRQRKRYAEHGFGLWSVVLKSTGEMIGQAGLTMQPYKSTMVPEIGYLLKKAFWHCGYAAEAAAGCKKYAFSVLHLSKVYAIIKADNTASIKVAQRIGMQKEDEFLTQYYAGERLHLLYSAENGRQCAAERRNL